MQVALKQGLCGATKLAFTDFGSGVCQARHDGYECTTYERRHPPRNAVLAEDRFHGSHSAIDHVRKDAGIHGTRSLLLGLATSQEFEQYARPLGRLSTTSPESNSCEWQGAHASTSAYDEGVATISRSLHECHLLNKPSQCAHYVAHRPTTPPQYMAQRRHHLGEL